MHHQSPQLAVLACIVCLTMAVTVCSGTPQDVRTSNIKQETLTPERATQALLVMMRSEGGKSVGWFKDSISDEMQKMKIYSLDDGGFAWSAYRFNPSQRSYSFEIIPSGPGLCAYFYNGTFEWKEGRWSATVPNLYMRGMTPPQ